MNATQALELINRITRAFSCNADDREAINRAMQVLVDQMNKVAPLEAEVLANKVAKAALEAPTNGAATQQDAAE